MQPFRNTPMVASRRLDSIVGAKDPAMILASPSARPLANTERVFRNQQKSGGPGS
jgi:hypothetical protein